MPDDGSVRDAGSVPDGGSVPDAGSAVADAAAGPSQMQGRVPDVGAFAASDPTSVASPDIRIAESTARSVRRGLPRVPGGEPWPPAGTVPPVGLASAASTPEAVGAGAEASPSQMQDDVPDAGAYAASDPTSVVSPDIRNPQPGSAVAVRPDVSTPLPWTRTVWNGRAPRHLPATAASARRLPTWPQAIAGLFGAAALGVLAGAAIAFVRALLSLPVMQDFLAAFPGEYEPPIPVEPGFAPWVNWAHFFNMFLIVLIIRSGLRVRTEKRPTVFWTPRNKPKGKISLTLWFHQALDILWLVNGVIFVVLLFVTGHWVRIVPTSWEVFPNALSAALQYVSFDWPHENGWNNYNSLQQLAYFVTVFVAAPLAAITGIRMSGLWPKRAERLSKAYPVEWARALHFPIMLYFVAFIIAHVALVMLTGFLRNLNHMYAAQDAATWTGFWVFIASLVVLAIGWAAARPLVLAPIAKLFGTVSGR
ncbi:cytochrome b/b6 domain-containing protein [Microbacterium sp. 179-I 3D2 NHS]|uniref:cytochrome b/b6 domain-containing protein n=1 Tax=Microbacterium sp. 179-I 3D2 NHS TaxID=3235178 RepID=UPI0039A31EBA